MPKDKSAPFNESMYVHVLRWLNDNQDINLPESLQHDLRHFNTLSDVEKEQLQVNLLALPQVPEVIQKFMPNRLAVLPNDWLKQIGSYLNPQQELKTLANLSRRTHSLFQPRVLHSQFLECIAYGRQDKAERLLTELFQGQEIKIQAALRGKGQFTDYSGRSFNCSAYEYAYWAKDRHMCRMLEQHMDAVTKAEMLRRCEAIEAEGLSYTQSGQVIVGSKHFDLTPLKIALQDYEQGLDAWEQAENWDAIKEALMFVGQAQRDVPAHVAQEYCRPDRSFDPLPQFDEEFLPRVLTYPNSSEGSCIHAQAMRSTSWFPLDVLDSAELGFDFAFIRGNEAAVLRARNGTNMAALDFAAVSRLDEVRTADLARSRENLGQAAEQGLGHGY